MQSRLQATRGTTEDIVRFCEVAATSTAHTQHGCRRLCEGARRWEPVGTPLSSEGHTSTESEPRSELMLDRDMLTDVPDVA
eukprot:scaffold141356_cov30-Tisochrysis_lutea.AAC.1